MLACLVLSLITAASWGSTGECEFPPEHPVHYSQLYSSQGQALVQVMDPVRVYVYNNTFSTCGGCVRSVTFCYSPGLDSVASETLFTVEIRKSDETIKTSYDVTVHPINDRNNRSNCISDLLDFPYCCIRVVVAESFSVNHNYHYALRVPSGLRSLLLRHQNELANGSQYDRSNSLIQDILYKPLLFFTIDSTTNFCTTITEISGTSVKSSPTISTTSLACRPMQWSGNESILTNYLSTTSPTVPKSRGSESQSSVGASPTDMSSTTSATATTDIILSMSSPTTHDVTYNVSSTNSVTTSATGSATATTVPTPPDVISDSGSQSSVGVGVGGGVGAALVLLVVGGCLFCVWRKRHTSKVTASGNNSVYISENLGTNIPANDNVAYGMSKKEMEMSCNVAYGVTNGNSEDECDYIPTTDGNDITTDNVPVSSNQAYGIVQH